MRNIDKKDIVPEKRIGKIRLGMNYDKLIKLLKFTEYTKEERASCFVIISDSIQMWVNKTSKVITQILVYNNFKGKINGKIGIGSTLKDVEKYIGKYEEDLGVYKVKNCPGVCFELEDADDCDENTAPIECISIYKG